HRRRRRVGGGGGERPGDGGRHGVAGRVRGAADGRRVRGAGGQSGRRGEGGGERARVVTDRAGHDGVGRVGQRERDAPGLDRFAEGGRDGAPDGHPGGAAAGRLRGDRGRRGIHGRQRHTQPRAELGEVEEVHHRVGVIIHD